jgi:hypothetical protein
MLHDTWLIRPHRGDFARLAYITGVAPRALHDMTLARYDGVAANLGRGGGRPRPSAWDGRATSRLCPECLADTGGRWQIAWRLNWTFACVKHGRLLVDKCPQCGGLQRHQPHSTLRVPAPKRCARTRQMPPSDEWTPCLADLSNAAAPALGDVQAVVQAQRHIDRLLDAQPTDLPLYRDGPPHPRNVLIDVKIIARWAISTIQLDEIVHHVPVDFVDSSARPRARAALGQNHRSNPTAAETAAGITMALNVLSAPDVKSSAHLLRTLMMAKPQRAGANGRVAGRASLSPVVRSVYDQACDSDER